ncbi:MAG: pilin [Dokdonella sp.]
MRHATLTFLASLLGALIALFAFHAYQAWDEQRQQPLRATVVATVDEQRRKLDQKVAAEQRSIELLRADIGAMTSAKVAVSESFMTTGRMPASNAEAGLPAVDSYRGRSLRSASVIVDGRIRLTFDGESGHDGGVIDLVPEVGQLDSMGVQWRCETADYPQIVRAVPTCDYVPSATSSK